MSGSVSELSKLKVRKATPEDIGWLLSQLETFSRVYTMKKTLMGSEDYSKTVLQNLIDHHLVLLAAPEVGEPVGFIAGLVTPHFFNPEIKTLAEIFWWVQEESRGTRAGYLLLKEFVAWGKEHVDWITVALEKHSPVSDSALTKRGFVHQEKSFLMEVH